MVGVQYGEIAMRSDFPALLYFTGIFITVHLEAKGLGLKGIPKDELPEFGPLFVRQGYLLIPLVALVAMVMMGYDVRAAIIATALAILVSMPNKETRMNPTRFINALEAGGKNTLSVAVACGVAGIIAGVVTMTGLGQLLISAIVGVAGDRVIVALFLTMLTCIVLGMGVPTTANYIIMATTCAPILVKRHGNQQDRCQHVRILLRYRSRYHTAGCSCSLRRIRDREIQPDEDRVKRIPSCDRSVHRTVYLRV